MKTNTDAIRVALALLHRQEATVEQVESVLSKIDPKAMAQFLVDALNRGALQTPYLNMGKEIGGLDAFSPYTLSDLEKFTGNSTAGPSEQAQFDASRLRRVAKLCGLGEAIPETDDVLLGCMGSVLGMIARKIDAGIPARIQSEQPDDAEDDAERPNT